MKLKYKRVFSDQIYMQESNDEIHCGPWICYFAELWLKSNRNVDEVVEEFRAGRRPDISAYRKNLLREVCNLSSVAIEIIAVARLSPWSIG